MGIKEAYQEKLEAQFKLWNAQIDLWEAKSERAAADAKIQYFETLESLKSKRHVLGDKLRQTREASTEAWEGVKGGLEAAWGEFKAAYERAAAKFQSSSSVELQPRERTTHDSTTHRT